MREIPFDVAMHAERLYDEGGYKTIPEIIAEAILQERERCRVACIDQAGRHAAYKSGKSEADACRACAEVIIGADPYDAFRKRFQ